MRLVSFRRADGTASFGRLEGEAVADLGGAGGGGLRAALAGGLDLSADGPALALADVELLPPIPDPGKIFCIGLNYASHVAEMGNTPPAYPTVFTRWPDTLAAHGAPLVRPKATERFDYEGELAVVIGRGGRAIGRAQALEHVAGYSVFNDASVRDWQRHSSQFTPGKNFPSSGGFGPALVTRDEIADLAAERVQTRLNGNTLQSDNTDNMMFPVAEMLVYITQGITLEPGDIIATGTPEGVGPLLPGDIVEVEIPGRSLLRNVVTDAAS